MPLVQGRCQDALVKRRGDARTRSYHSRLGFPEVPSCQVQAGQQGMDRAVAGSSGAELAMSGMYTSAIHLIGTISDLGIESASVRRIAVAAGKGDEDTVARTVVTLRRTSLLWGLAGMAAALA